MVYNSMKNSLLAFDKISVWTISKIKLFKEQISSVAPLNSESLGANFIESESRDFFFHYYLYVHASNKSIIMTTHIHLSRWHNNFKNITNKSIV